jgi:glycosyltransferase involved in cell wall biosynthesis
MQKPLVSVVTPVRNGAAFIRECIESVQAQDYQAYEHIVVDNCSTDHTADIAERYAADDQRIRVIRNPAPVPMIRNWNTALAAMAIDSVWCKTLHGDDYLYEGCLRKMVALGSADPTIGVIGSLRNRGAQVECEGLPPGISRFSGREIACGFLTRTVFAIAPTSGMIRTDLVRSRHPFYPEDYLHADIAAYLDILHGTNFGFIPEVLAFSRVHANSVSATVASQKRTLEREWIRLLDEFGPRYFPDTELRRLKQEQVRRSLRVICKGIANGRGADFVRYHLDAVKGRELDRVQAALVRTLDGLVRLGPRKAGLTAGLTQMAP